MKKVVITSVPYTETSEPLMAPAALKSIVEKTGNVAVAFDLNAIIYNSLQCNINQKKLKDFFILGHKSKEILSDIRLLFDDMCSRIVEHHPDIICLSLLHNECQVATEWLCYLLRKKAPAAQIIIGGPGIGTTITVVDEDSFISRLKKNQLIDFYVFGDGERALEELLTGNNDYPGINNNNWQELDNLDEIPYPNYDDYDLSLYKSPYLGILGSRGCVRQCTFCDVHEFWKTFRYRSAQNIFDEIMAQHQKYNIRKFKFQDSLVNGNMKEYKQLVTLLADYNAKNPSNSISWSSYFIFRPKEQMPEEIWRLAALSGARNLIVGVEHFSERIRVHMKKKFDDSSILYGLEMAEKYGINLHLLMLIGYVIESDQDHQINLQWLHDNQRYAKTSLAKLILGSPLAILPNTWIDRNQKSLGVTWGSSGNKVIEIREWAVESTGLTIDVRTSRLQEMYETAQRLGYSVVTHHAVDNPEVVVENILVKQEDRFCLFD